MILDAILEAIGPVIRNVFGYIVCEIIIQTMQTICYATGFAITRLVTFGKYPKSFILPKYIPRKFFTQPQGWVVVTGILFWCLIILSGILIF